VNECNVGNGWKWLSLVTSKDDGFV